MKKFGLFLLFCATFLFAKEPQDIVDTNCSTCHGTMMEKACFGVSKIPNTLSEQTILEALSEYKEGKRNTYSMGGAMTARTNMLSDEEIKALASYVHELGKKASQ